MPSILEELWEKIQEYEKEQEAKKLENTVKRQKNASPKRRSERIRQLLKSTINESLSVGSSPSKCIEELRPSRIDMERESAEADPVAVEVGGKDNDCMEQSNVDKATENIGLAEELECSGIDTSSSCNDTSHKTNSSSSSDDSQTTENSSENQSSEKTSCESTDVSQTESKSDVSSTLQSPEGSETKGEAVVTSSEPDSSTALGILNQLSEELSCLNRDGASLTTTRHDPKKLKNRRSKMTPSKSPSKIKFNFKTPTKSPSRLSSAVGSATKGTFGRSPGRSPFKFGFKTPTRQRQRTPINPSLQVHGGRSVKRKVLHDSASSSRKQVKTSGRKRKRRQTKKPAKKARVSEGGENSSSSGDDHTDDPETKKTGWTSSESESSSDEENPLTIMSESDTEVDEVLDEKRSTALLKLTVRNVRSLLKAVIGNEHVQDMLRNTLQEDGLGDALKEAIFEPKMTRSKVKQVLEQEGGQIPHHMSPLKCLKVTSREPSPTILDLNFTEEEDEDDEEYKPTAEDINQMASDDETETESVTSSQASDFGSPMVSTPLTPRFMTPRTPLDESTPFSTPKSMCAPLSERQALASKAKCVRDITKSDELNLSSTSIEEEELIAKRTRSKLPMKDTLLEEIEANFVAPDITPDMYDTTCDDQDWKLFLGSLVTEKAINDTNDDEASDPEFNILDELEMEKTDLIEEMRSDRAVNISKKELHSLMDELFEAYNSGEPEMEVNEWKKERDKKRHKQQQEKEKKNKKTEALPVEKPAELPTATASTSSDAVKEAIIVTVVEKKDDEPKVSPSALPNPAIEKIANAEDDASSEGSSETGSSEATEDFRPYVPPLKLGPEHTAMLVRDLLKGNVSVRQPQSQQDEPLSEAPRQLSDSERTQLEDQMRKHVQLCTQMFVLTVDDPEFQEITNAERSYMRELKAFGDRTLILSGQLSAFHPCNMNAALRIVSKKSCCTAKELETLKEKKERKNLKKGYMDLLPLSMSQMQLFATSKVFLFPQMLPEGLFFSRDINEKRKCIWLPSEDNLLAIGYDQFGDLKGGQCQETISKLLVPTKNKAQIYARLKNLRCAKAPPNSLKYLKEHKELPEFPRYTELEDLNDIVAPQDRDPSVLPSWFKNFETKKPKKSSPPKQSGVFVKILPNCKGPEISSPKAIEMPKHLTSTPTGSTPIPRVCSPALTPVQLARSATKVKQEPKESPKSSKFILPKSAFVPVGSSPVQLAGGPGFTPSVIGITQVTLANTVVASGVPTVQTAGGRTSPLIVMAPNQLQQFGAQIIMLPSPNQIAASPQTRVVETTGVQVHTAPQPSAETNVESDADAAVESCTTLNTISLPETSSCSPDGEALLEKLDKMNTSNVVEISPLKNLSESAEAVDLHELTAYLTHGEEEASVMTASTHSDTITSQASATVTSSLETVVTTTVVSSEHSTDSIDTVTRSLGFNPISPAEPEIIDKVKTLDSQENSGPSEKQKHDTDVEMSESAKLLQVVSPSVSSRPSSREGMYPSVSLQGGRSRPNSQGAAHSPSTKQIGGFVQLGEHTRDSPNIFVSIQSAMPPTGKMGTVLTVSSRIGELSEARCSPLSEIGMRGIMSTGGDGENAKAVSGSDQLIKDILLSCDSNEAPQQEKVVPPKTRNPLLDDDSSLEAKTSMLNESVELHLEAPEVPCEKVPIPETPKKSMDVLCTPVKLLPSEKPGTYTSPMYQASPPVVVTPPANTPTKAAVEIMAAIAQIMTTPSKAKSPTKTPSKSSPPAVTMVIKTPPSKKNLMSMMSPGKSFSSFVKSPIIMQPLPSLPDTPESHKRSENLGISPLMTSPEKNTLIASSPRTPQKYKPILPKLPVGFMTSPLKCPSPAQRRSVKKSPRRQILKQQARAIMPKGFTLQTITSPVKIVAANITAKAKRGKLAASPVKGAHVRRILPKPSRDGTSPPKVTFMLSPRKTRRRRASKKQRKNPPKSQTNSQIETEMGSDLDEQGNEETMDAHSDCETMESEYCSDENEEKENNHESVKFKKVKRKRKRRTKKKSQVETEQGSDDNGRDSGDGDLGDNEDDDVPTDDDEDHLADLMAAATTINFDSRRQSSPSDEKRRGTSQVLRDKTLQMFAPDLIENDPLKDERDMAFAQAFLSRARVELRSDTYGEVLGLIQQFDQVSDESQSPVLLFGRMKELLEGHEDLVKLFSGFLFPDQAMTCGYLKDQQEFSKIRLFLRKVEVYFKKHPNYLQKIHKHITNLWKTKGPTTTRADIKKAITPMLRGQKHLLEEFSTFFEDERPPESYMTDFEEVVLRDSDDENTVQALIDEVEEIYLPDDIKDYRGTQKCKCQCHRKPKSKQFAARKRHCNSCAIKIINGQLFLQTTEKQLRPVHIVYKIPPKKKREENETVPRVEEPEIEISDEEDEAVPFAGELSSDDSGLSSGAEDGGKNEAASEEEDEARSEGAESDGAESEGDDTRRKEKNGHVSSGEESVVNGVNTDNDETSKDSEGKGGGTSCTDVESVNFNTEGSNTTSVVNSVGTLSEESTVSDAAKGSDSGPAIMDGTSRSPKQPTDFSTFTEEIRKARESVEGRGSLEGLAKELESRVEEDASSSSGSKSNEVDKHIETEEKETFSLQTEEVSDSVQKGESEQEMFVSRGIERTSDPGQFQMEVDEHFNTSSETLKATESDCGSSDSDEILHQTDGSNDSYSVRKHALFRQMTITTETVSTITKYSEDSITSPFKHLSKNPMISALDKNNLSTGIADSNSNASQSRMSLSQGNVSDTMEGGSYVKHSCGSNDGSDGNISEGSKVTREGSQNQDADLVYHTSDEASQQSAANTSTTSLNTTMETNDRTVVSVCEDTMIEVSLDQESETEFSSDKNTADKESASASGNEERPWTRDEDQMLLVSCKEHGTGADTWQMISQSLPHRSVEEITDRYWFLMERLQSWLKSTTTEQTSGETDSEGSESDGETNDSSSSDSDD